MANLEYLEKKYGLESGGDWRERAERIRAALADELDRTDPEMGDRLRRYSEVDLVCFIDKVVKNGTRRDA